MLSLKRFWMLSVFALQGLTACDAWTVKPFCERQFLVESQAAACTLGASQLADEVIAKAGLIDAEKGTELCASRCTDVYSSDEGGSVEVYAELGNMLVACTQGCQASVEYQRAAVNTADVSDCFRGPGGIVRCY